MPTKRVAITRAPSTWVTAFRDQGVVPSAQDDRAGWLALDRWCLGEAVPGLPPCRSVEGQSLIDQAVARGWTPLR